MNYPQDFMSWDLTGVISDRWLWPGFLIQNMSLHGRRENLYGPIRKQANLIYEDFHGYEEYDPKPGDIFPVRVGNKTMEIQVARLRVISCTVGEDGVHRIVEITGNCEKTRS